MRRCSVCDLVYLWPRPTENELEAYYASDRYRSEYPHPPEQVSRDEWRRRLELIRPLLRPTTRLLDVGSGSGGWLDVVRPHVAVAEGVEPEAGSTLADVDGTYDLVSAHHVLEHVSDPVRFVRTMASLTNAGGVVVVEVPNVDDLLLLLPWFRRFYFQRPHLWYFSRRTLHAVFAEASLTVEIAGYQRYDLANHLRWAVRRRPGGHGRYPIPGSVRRNYAGAVARSGRSDTLIAHGFVDR